jgi:hypothetical protein
MINVDGSLDPSKVVKEIKKVIKSVDDTLYFCFDEIQPENRVKVTEAIVGLKKLANEIEQAQDEFFNS